MVAGVRDAGDDERAQREMYFGVLRERAGSPFYPWRAWREPILGWGWRWLLGSVAPATMGNPPKDPSLSSPP